MDHDPAYPLRRLLPFPARRLAAFPAVHGAYQRRHHSMGAQCIPRHRRGGHAHVRLYPLRRGGCRSRIRAVGHRAPVAELRCGHHW